jgi:histidinol dehydrogenase
MNAAVISRLDTANQHFDQALSQLLAWESVSDASIAATVAEIIQQIKTCGDAALLEYTNKFDRRHAAQISDLMITNVQLTDALTKITAEQRQELETAAARIREYHQHQLQTSWQYTDADGTRLGQQITAMERVGLYVPGGKASYPSSVLMNAIPAKVAGVNHLTMVVPAPDNQLSPMVLAAASIAGVDQVITVGGAQAIAALAYGTESIHKVDKIVGPGNAYVATAKRAVFGQVAIDMIAGPSEILILCDGLTDPDWIAMDLLSQAEHDEQAQAILLCVDAEYLNRVEQSLTKLLPTLEREKIAAVSLSARGALIKVNDVEEAIQLINRIAPEHLELSVADPEALLPQIRHAGAIFMGRYTPEALGDYCAGPNHVLPTSGTARFSSPLGVYDFQKRSSVIYCTATSSAKLSRTASVLARSELLTAHARSAEYRF